jgi:hypothetical protein
MESAGHVEAAQSGQNDPKPRLWSETALNGPEHPERLGRIAHAPQPRDQRGGDEADAADPQQDADDVNRAGDSEGLHLCGRAAGREALEQSDAQASGDPLRLFAERGGDFGGEQVGAGCMKQRKPAFEHGRGDIR